MTEAEATAIIEAAIYLWSICWAIRIVLRQIR